MRILLADDDKNDLERLRQILKSTNAIDLGFDGEMVLNLVGWNSYDLIILSRNLAKGNGIYVCQNLREMEVTTPVLMLGSQRKIDEIVEGLNIGADDYMVKPVEIEEFKARVMALGRRGKGFVNTTLECGRIKIERDKNRVYFGEKEVNLRKKEYLLLEYLIKNKGNVLSRDQIMERVWDMNAELTSNTIDVQIKSLRDKMTKILKENMIMTIHGVGYRIENKPKKEK